MRLAALTFIGESVSQLLRDPARLVVRHAGPSNGGIAVPGRPSESRARRTPPACPPAPRAAKPAPDRPPASVHGRSRSRAAPCAPAPSGGRVRECRPRLVVDVGRAGRPRTTSQVAARRRRASPRATGERPCGRQSVDVVLRVVDVELAGRRDQVRILDHRLQLAGLVVHHHDRGLLVLGAPHREPDFVAGLVVLRAAPRAWRLRPARPTRRSAAPDSPCRDGRCRTPPPTG